MIGSYICIKGQTLILLLIHHKGNLIESLSFGGQLFSISSRFEIKRSKKECALFLVLYIL